MAMAAEGENVVLKFSQSQNLWLYITLGCGLVAVLYALIYLRSVVMKASPGSEAMQEVGLAIREGALAYLRKQMGTMVGFVVVLAVGLFFLYRHLGTTAAIGVPFCFVLGVAGSYLAGWAGMLMAVAGNMRTAHAALTSYKQSLEVAFRAGAVAGLVTVGIALIGASGILLIEPGKATLLLIGFGFGGSLAALFMRVGGGIFTKAADVGADLVGKVEAGIPEDDPRNPAVIADNVGDNVGDCAGMAADVFESYVVTLVAAIVLGAATASVFDGQTWPRLVIFALAVCGVGLIASIIGVEAVRGNEDIDSDPLKTIRKGLGVSVGLAIIGTFALAYIIMGGTGKPVTTARLVPVLQSVKNEIVAIHKAQREAAETQKKDVKEIKSAELIELPQLQKLGFKKEDEAFVADATRLRLDRFPPIPNLESHRKVEDLGDTTNKALDYSVQHAASPTDPPGTKRFASVAEEFGGTGDKAYVIAQVSAKGTRPAQAGQGFGAARPAETIDQNGVEGPVPQALLTEIIKQRQAAEPQGSTVKHTITKAYPLELFAAPNGDLALVLSGYEGRVAPLIRANVPFYKKTVAELEALQGQAKIAPDDQPETGQFQIATLDERVVPWWAFALTVLFGIAMAYVIERLTDYFVGTNRKPTQEIAGVSTAGAAPMIIQGFAHAKTSSVFMLLVIVFALMLPIWLFPPTQYGSYILSFYGVALVGIGLLTTTGFVLAMDTFGPISDNAQGVFEMSGAGHTNERGAKIVGRLDAAGNTTKALTKGFAIATAVIAAVALFHSYLEGAHLSTVGLRLDVPEIFLGLLLGGAAPFLFSAFAINAVGRASFELINEVRRQFRNDPGIMAGTSKPDYARCVALVTAAAQKELLAPGILAITLPAAVGFGFSIGKPPVEINGEMYNLTGAQALGGFLAGAIVTGQLLAVLLANSGGMWDNAKKLIEDGLHGGKGTDAHKAAVIGDTIGDPFKDTAGPALNPLIKVMNLVALLIAGVVVKPLADSTLITITLILVAALVVTTWLAKRGSLSDAFEAAKAEAPATDGSSPALVESKSTSIPMEVVSNSEAEGEPKPKKKKLFVDEDSES